MPYLKYYRDERKRHPEAELVRLTIEECQELSNQLCDHFNVRRCSVFLITKGGRSFYRPFSSQIHMLKSRKYDMLHVRTLVHEVCHHVENVNRKPGSNEHYHGPKHRRYVDAGITFVKTLPIYKVPKPDNIQKPIDKSHTSAVVWLNGLFNFTNPTPNPAFALNSLMSTQTDPIQTVLNQLTGGAPFDPQAALTTPIPAPTPIVDLVAAAFNALPAELTCPKCHLTKPKEVFGTRVTKKDAEGKPLKVVRQSYCKGCRSSKG